MGLLAEWLQAAAAAVTLVRLYYLGLARKQPALFTFLLFTALSLSILASIPTESAIYFWMYMLFDVLNWIVLTLVVREIFTLILNDYPGIRTAARWALYWSLGVAACCALILGRLFWTPRHDSHLYYLLVGNRSVVFTLSAIVILILLFLSRYPLHLPMNTYISSLFFGAIFLSEAVATLIDSLETHFYSPYVDAAQVGFAALCFAGWAVMLKPVLEIGPTRVTFESPGEHELLQQLESLNRLLSRAGRQ